LKEFQIMNHIADNQDALLDYLYEEGDPAERLAIAKHLQECAPCSVAVLEFQSVRGMLSDWTPPATHLGFRVVQDAGQSLSASSPSATLDPGARGGRWRGWGPATYQEKLTGARLRAALQAAAAILLFVSGMAVSQLDVEYHDDGFTVRRQPVIVDVPPMSPGRNASIELPAERVDINEIERELRGRLESRNASSVDIESLLQRVRTMIDQSEQRQQRELALRLSQVAREVDTQHQADLLRVQQEFGQQQEATMDYLVRTSGGTK
jgi:hypothetical protein